MEFVTKWTLRFALRVPRYLAGVGFGDDFQGECNEQATSAATVTTQKQEPALAETPSLGTGDSLARRHVSEVLSPDPMTW